MTTTLNASTAGAGGFIATGDNSGSLALQTAGTTAVTIDASQNVGIGTTSPTAKLDVSSNSAGVTAGDLVVDTANKTVYVGRQSSTGGDNSYLVVRGRVNGSGTNQAIAITGDTSAYGTGLFRPGNDSLGFSTLATERMRIDSSGNLLVGTSTSTGAKFDVSQSVNTAAATVFFDARQATTSNQYGIVQRLLGDPNNTSQYIFQGIGNTTERVTIRSNGGLANYSGNNVNLSDRREKTNFAPAKAYLDIVCNIPVQTFNYIDQNREEDDGLTLGVVAQDVQAVAPELVMESNWGSKEEPKMRLSVYQTDLQYALMKSIQELKAINDTQAETINALTARIVALEEK